MCVLVFVFLFCFKMLRDFYRSSFDTISLALWRFQIILCKLHTYMLWKTTHRIQERNTSTSSIVSLSWSPSPCTIVHANPRKRPENVSFLSLTAAVSLATNFSKCDIWCVIKYKQLSKWNSIISYARWIHFKQSKNTLQISISKT